jgi:hypothetical protein
MARAHVTPGCYPGPLFVCFQLNLAPPHSRHTAFERGVILPQWGHILCATNAGTACRDRRFDRYSVRKTIAASTIRAHMLSTVIRPFPGPVPRTLEALSGSAFAIHGEAW